MIVTRACTCFSLGAFFLMVDHSVILSIYLRSSALNARVRVCMGVGLYRGVDAKTLARLLGVHLITVQLLLGPLVNEKILGRVRTGHDVRYHSTLAAKKLVRAELRRIRLEGANLERELRQHPRIKPDKLDKLLGILPDDQG